MNTAHVAFFGDKEHTFHLTDDMILELERITGAGVGSLFLRLVASQFHLGDLTAIIRLGLIGGGMAPQRALDLIQTYAVNAPLDQTFPLALEILTARYAGTTDDQKDAA